MTGWIGVAELGRGIEQGRWYGRRRDQFGTERWYCRGQGIGRARGHHFVRRGCQACKAFYGNIFGLEVVHENADSAVVKLRNLMINLLTVENAPTLVKPTTVGAAQVGSRALYTIKVENVATTVIELERHGVIN